MSHLSKTVILIVSIVFVSACSVKTLYNKLDYLLPEYVEAMVSLDDVLEQEVDQKIILLLKWHRQTELKQYAEWLRGLQQDVNSTLTEQKVLQHTSELEQFWQRLSAKVYEEMAQLLPLLDREQQDELFGNIAHKNEAFRKEHVDLEREERVDAYHDRLLDTCESWLGELTDDQTLVIKQASAELVSAAELWFQRRLSWQFGTKKILAKAESSNEKTEQLHNFFEDFRIIKNKALIDNAEFNKAIIARLVVLMSQKLTEDQKVHFINKTDDYIRMFIELAENR